MHPAERSRRHHHDDIAVPCLARHAIGDRVEVVDLLCFDPVGFEPFNDCRHLTEPRCAVLAAVAAGTINEARHDSYRRLVLEAAVEAL